MKRINLTDEEIKDTFELSDEQLGKLKRRGLQAFKHSCLKGGELEEFKTLQFGAKDNQNN